MSRFARLVLTVTSTAFLAVACEDPLANPEDAAAARAHLENLLDVMEANSINRNRITWAEFRTTVLAAAPDPQDIGETFDAIYVALGLLGDNHSSYTGPANYPITIRNSRITCTAPLVPQAEVPQDIGYVRVAGFSGAAALATSYARSVQLSIRNEDAAHPIAWIVDLRGNSGGNMWPMIAGLGPILGERILGYFIDPDGVESRWEYRGGLSILGGLTMQAVTDPYTLASPEPKVAVLTDGNVASSGEATAIAFKGRPNTRFFGAATCGLSTANEPFMVDGATLTLTVSTIADRNKVAYGDTLPPDEVIMDNTELLNRAISWIRGG
jgi:hypothetical protein